MSGIRLIVGLGNPGSEYEATRHNVGFRFVDRLAEFGGGRFSADAKLQSLSAQVALGSNRVILVKPSTYMNRSGVAVAAALRYWKIAPEEMLVCHDDLDLAPGKFEIKSTALYKNFSQVEPVQRPCTRSDPIRLYIPGRARYYPPEQRKSKKI